MVNYRRYKIRGGTYFFTVVLQDRQSSLLTAHIDLLRESIKQAQSARPFKINAMVVLPDHLHAIWELPDNTDDYSQRIRLMKCHFTRKVVKINNTYTKNLQGAYNIWQPRFWEHMIRDDKDYENHANYIHYNPVKHKLVTRVADWPYSSFHRYVREGLLPKNWCAEGALADIEHE